MALISNAFLVYSCFNTAESITYCSHNFRVQFFLSHFCSVFFNIFLPLAIYENDFSVLYVDGNPLPNKVTNIQQPAEVSRGWMILCLFMGYITEIVLLFNSELFTSHFFRPVRSLLDKSENGPCLNLFSSAIISLITYLIPLFFFFLSFFVCYGTLGYLGLALCAMGLIGNLIPLFCINTLGSISENALKMAKLTKLLKEDFRKSPLFITQWTSQNFTIHIRMCCFSGFFFVGMGLLGGLIGNCNIPDILSLKTLQLTGIIFGSLFPFLFMGIILGCIQKILQTNVIFKNFIYL